MIEILSFMTEPNPTREHYTFWRDGICKALCEKLGEIICLEKGVKTAVDYEIIPWGGGQFKVESKYHDIAFVPYSWHPDKRPADFIFTFASDIEGYEEQMINWQDHVKPNLIGCLQDMPGWLGKWGKENGCKVIKLPWFVYKDIEYNEERDIVAFCSGAIGNTYPMRTKIYHELNQLKNINTEFLEGDIILSCGDFGKYPLSTGEYNETLKKSRYYCSGGIKDRMIPPKYFEAMNAGCCLITPSLDWFKELGFVDCRTHIEIKNPDEIKSLIQSSHWYEIGREGKKFVEKNHTVTNRAKRILEIYNEYVGRKS